jgi:hypothetical protein
VCLDGSNSLADRIEERVRVKPNFHTRK